MSPAARAADSKALRVLATADAVGGVWQYALQLAQVLGAAGAETVLAVTGPPPSPAQCAEADAVFGLHLVHAPHPLDWTADGQADLGEADAWIAALAEEARPDVVHLNGCSAVPWAADRPVVQVLHSCVPTWFRAVRGEDPPPAWDAYRARIARCLAHADVAVAPTAAHAAAVAEAYRVPVPRAIHNARSACDFAGRRKRGFVLGAGRLWDPAKNLAVLDRAATRLDWPVYLAGSAEGPHGMRAELSGGAHALGQLDGPRMRRTLAQAAIFCAPARYEPFGLAVLEAALGGCALVLSDIPSFRELWGGAAVFVEPDEAAALADALAQLAAEPELRRRHAAAARRRARRYAPDRMAQRYLDLYGELLGPRAQPAALEAAQA
jgi:glycosyltransferase involved in cell wall biosynthesis